MLIIPSLFQSFNIVNLILGKLLRFAQHPRSIKERFRTMHIMLPAAQALLTTISYFSFIEFY